LLQLFANAIIINEKLEEDSAHKKKKLTGGVP
jgi:hypothetical protein